MNLFTALDVNAGGLTAQRKRAEVASSNLANAQTTRTPDGGPYRRKDVVFETTGFADSPASVLDRGVEGVRVSDVVEDPRPFRPSFRARPSRRRCRRIPHISQRQCEMINRPLDLGKY
jgi:flagellar basal-body rod protein FlgC